MGKVFTYAELDAMTSKGLKRMCIDELGIVGVSKKPKDVVIKAILAKYGSSAAAAAPKAAIAPKAPVTAIQFQASSILTKPTAKFGDKTTTTINVSCGASSGNFPVVGKTVKEVGDFLREVLNVDRLSTGLVNGQEVSPEYVLTEKDNLEFLKPAGQKG